MHGRGSGADGWHRGDAPADTKNTILAGLIESAKSDDRAGDCALTLALLQKS